jgi:MoaA/NifB/PqqE/SkfB family radical SAM enzyme
MPEQPQTVYAYATTCAKASLWKKIKPPVSRIDFELTERCNNNCVHCCINLSENDSSAKQKELSTQELKRILKEAAELGALTVRFTGGEPLLREDFFEIYLGLKKKGLLVSVFTNACLINAKHIELFKKYPPRDIEVTVYGITERTYERVTNQPGSFAAFMRGLELLLENKVRVRFKAMALRSNVGELREISKFCRERTKDYFRFDPQLHLRFDRDEERNKLIQSERLSPEEIVTIERADDERFTALRNGCDRLINPEFAKHTCSHLFHCGAGNGNFEVSYDGFFRLCSSLWHPATLYD